MSGTLPKVPQTVNADMMNAAEIHVKLQECYEDIETGMVQDAASAFEKFREKEQSEESGIPYQTLINLYLSDCAKHKKQFVLIVLMNRASIKRI